MHVSLSHTISYHMFQASLGKRQVWVQKKRITRHFLIVSMKGQIRFVGHRIDIVGCGTIRRPFPSSASVAPRCEHWIGWSLIKTSCVAARHRRMYPLCLIPAEKHKYKRSAFGVRLEDRFRPRLVSFDLPGTHACYSQ